MPRLAPEGGGKAWLMLSSVHAAANALREVLHTFDAAAASPEDCAAIADELARTEKACAAVRLLATTRAAARGAHRERGFGDPASWFARQAGTTTSQARRALETAAGLERCSQTKQALLAGEVSVSQAHEIVKAETESPGQEEDLLSAARTSDLSKLREHVRARRFERTAPEELHRLQLAARRFRHWRDGLGMVCFEGALPAHAGVPFINRIDLLAQRARRAAAREGRSGERFEAHAADAVSSLAANGDSDTRAPRAELVIVCDLFAYRRGHVHNGESCHVIDGAPVPVEIARELTRDAFVKAVLHDGVEIQRIKHFGRHLPAELKTALDLGPVPAFSGRECADCGRRYGLEYDHVDPVAHQGPTSYENVEARCYADHLAKTERDRKAGLLGPGCPPPPRAAQRSHSRAGP